MLNSQVCGHHIATYRHITNSCKKNKSGLPVQLPDVWLSNTDPPLIARKRVGGAGEDVLHEQAFSIEVGLKPVAAHR